MKSQLRIALPVAASAIGILLAGCGGSGTSAGSAPAVTKTVTASPSAPAGSAAPGTSAPATSTPTPSDADTTVPHCTVAALTIHYTGNAAIRHGALDGTSHADRVITFSNDGNSTCELAGYPGVAALDAAGHQIKQAARVSDAASVIVLHPSQVASAEVFGNTASCAKPTQVAGLLVTAPDERSSTRLGAYGSVCLSSLQIGTVKHGNAAGLNLG
jgi:Protein of unknown function (DUF4232)